jgi:hypothetical protein
MQRGQGGGFLLEAAALAFSRPGWRSPCPAGNPATHRPLHLPRPRHALRSYLDNTVVFARLTAVARA